MSKQDKSGNVKGAQEHAEGQQGDKAHAKFIENLHQKNGSTDEQTEAHQGRDRDGFDEFGQPHKGGHRLREDREQHDEAEKNSELKRTHPAEHH